MTIALTLEEYLEDCDVKYEHIPHKPTTDSISTAAIAHIPGDRFAKSVVLSDENGYLMVVLPATYYVDLDEVERKLQRHMVLANEEEITDLFWDCEKGAIPPIGEAYGIDVLMDEHLGPCQDIYFEAGSHSDMLHMSGKHFRKIMRHAEHGLFSMHNK